MYKKFLQSLVLAISLPFLVGLCMWMERGTAYAAVKDELAGATPASLHAVVPGVRMLTPAESDQILARINPNLGPVYQQAFGTSGVIGGLSSSVDAGGASPAGGPQSQPAIDLMQHRLPLSRQLMVSAEPPACGSLPDLLERSRAMAAQHTPAPDRALIGHLWLNVSELAERIAHHNEAIRTLQTQISGCEENRCHSCCTRKQEFFFLSPLMLLMGMGMCWYRFCDHCSPLRQRLDGERLSLRRVMSEHSRLLRSSR